MKTTITEQEIREIVQAILSEGEWQKYFKGGKEERPTSQKKAIADANNGSGFTPGVATSKQAGRAVADFEKEKENPRGEAHTKEFGKQKGGFVSGQLEERLRKMFRTLKENIGEKPQSYTTTGGGDGGDPANKQDKNYQTSGAQVENPPSNGDTPAAYNTTSAGDSGDPANKQDKDYQTSGAQVENAPTDGDTPAKMTYESMISEIVERVMKEGKWGPVSPDDPALAGVKKKADAGAAKFDKGSMGAAPPGVKGKPWEPPTHEKGAESPGRSQMTKKGIYLDEEGKEAISSMVTEAILKALRP